MSPQKRFNFSGKVGIILTMAGSAVGLANVWRFPYMAGENGGWVFMMIYVVCVMLLGVPCMMSEFIIGRHGQSNVLRAYRKLSEGGVWTFMGYVCFLTGFLISGYYALVSGWCLHYVFASALGHNNGDVAFFASSFAEFTGNPVKPVFWIVVILLLTYLIVKHGVRNGIESFSKILMPLLAVLLLIIVGTVCMLPGAGKGIAYFFKPDFTAINGDMLLGALGQAFFSLSLSMGCICTYASYFQKSLNLMNTAIQVSVIDCIVAVLAGLVIFPAAFSVGISPDSGPSLLFVTMPRVFQQAFSALPVVGYLIKVLFFVLLSLVALTSLISLLEVTTTFFQEELYVTRKEATAIAAIATALIGTLCSLSIGSVDFLTIGGKPLFEWFDFLTGQIFLPMAGLLNCVFIGWFLPHKIVQGEFTNWGTLRGRFFHFYIFLVKYFCPVCILYILLHEFDLL